MPKITQFDRKNIRALVDAMEEALAPVAEKYGLKLERKNLTYHQEDTPVPFRFLVVAEDENGNAMSSDAKDLVRFGKVWGLLPTDLNREVTIGRRTLRIVGLRPRSRKYPVLLEDVRTGKTYKYPAEAVTQALK